MWQTLAVILIVALAAGFLLRRMGRQFRGKQAACCGGGGADESACAACQSAGRGGQGGHGGQIPMQAQPAGPPCACCGQSSPDTLKEGR